MRAGDQLKALREEAGLTIRDMAAALNLGDNHNGYAYYEKKGGNGPYLPREKVDRYADVLERHGIDRARVLKLAGVEVVPSSRGPALEPAFQIISLAVALPSEGELTNMIEGMLETTAPELADTGLARKLAQRLPVVLQQTAARHAGQARQPAEPTISRGEDARPLTPPNHE